MCFIYQLTYPPTVVMLSTNVTMETGAIITSIIWSHKNVNVKYFQSDVVLFYTLCFVSSTFPTPGALAPASLI